MRKLEVESAKWTRGATVQLRDGFSISYRAALFVLPLPGGWCWVEPSYLDDAGPGSPAYHVAQGEARDLTPFGAASGLSFFELRSWSGWSAMIYPADNEDPEDVLQALQQGLSALGAQGTTWDAERERIAASIDVTADDRPTVAA